MQFLPGDLAQLQVDDEANRRRQAQAQALQQAGFNPVQGGNSLLAMLSSVMSTVQGGRMMNEADAKASEIMAKRFEIENQQAQAKMEADAAKEERDWQRKLKEIDYGNASSAKYREPGNIDPNSPAGIAARLQFEKGKAGLQPKPAGPGAPAWQQAIDAAAAQGIELTPAERKQLITGLKTEQPQQNGQARFALENSLSNLDRLKDAANEVSSGNVSGISGLQGMFPNAPGGAAANTAADLEALKSQVGFGVLQAMKDASKTGGALGNVSEKEIILLQNNLAALDTNQSPAEFKRELKKIVDYADGVRQRQIAAYESDNGPYQQQGAPQAQPQPAQGQPTQTATNPQTGQKIGLINGQWVPL